MTNKGKLSRNKGKVWEREVATVFRALFGDQVRRGWQARNGHDAPDVEGVPRFLIEAKHHHVVNIAAAVKQAVCDRAKKGELDKWVLAVTKSDRAMPLATMPLSEFMQLLREWVTALEEQAHLEAAAKAAGWNEEMSTTPALFLKNRFELLVPVVKAAAQVCADPMTPQSSALHDAMVTAGLWPADGKTNDH